MYKNIVCVLFYLSMTLPVVLSAGTLERYSVPQQQSGSSAQPNRHVSENVYNSFRIEIQGYTQNEINILRDQLYTRMREANRARNHEAASHYERLISIIESE